MSSKKLPHIKVRATPANCLAPIVAFPKKRRGAGGLTAGNGKNRQRSARPPKVSKTAKGRSRSQWPSLLPNGRLCFPMAVFALSPQSPSRSPATPSQAHPPKTQDSFIKRIPSPFSGVPYRAPIKNAHCVRFGVNRYSLAGASATALYVYSCIQMFTDVPFA